MLFFVFFLYEPVSNVLRQWKWLVEFPTLVVNLQVHIPVFTLVAISCAPSPLIHLLTRPARSENPEPTSQGKFNPTNSHFTAVVVYCFSSRPSPLPSSHPTVPSPSPVCSSPGEKPVQMLATLEQYTFAALFSSTSLQCCPGGHLKHLPHTVLRLGRAFHVTKCCDSSGHVPALLRLHRLLVKKDKWVIDTHIINRHDGC